MRTEQAKGQPGARGGQGEAETALRDRLAEHVTASELSEPIADRRDWVRCYACGHLCRIPPGRDGICRVRMNVDGTLLVPEGYVAALQCDPVEKKPFFHVLPGNLAMSFGMLGCDYHCSYCQNWLTSQSLRDPDAVAPIRPISPKAIVEIAQAHAAPIVVSTYNEPLITSEWAVKVFRVAKEHGLLCGYVSNGNATPGVLDYLRPWMDLYKVDLKGFDDRRYRQLGGLLSTVLTTIENLKARGFWVEVVTLLVPGFNDSDAEVTKICQFLAQVDRDIPWHVTAFRRDYKMTDRSDTDVESLLRAVSIARAAGLRYVYAGNRPGRVGSLENTHCPSCSALLIERLGYIVRRNRLQGGSCPDCGQRIPGVWSRPGTTR